MTITLLSTLLACTCSLQAPLVGGGLRLPDFTETDTAAAADTGAPPDTGDAAEAGLDRTTTTTAVITALNQLDDSDSPDGTGTARGVKLGFNGPWTHLALQTEEGSTGDAWFVGAAHTLVDVGETVRLVVEEGQLISTFSLFDGDGRRRFWVGQSFGADGVDPAAGLSPADDLAFAEGDPACVASGRCQDEAQRDLVVTDPNGSFVMQFGSSVEHDGDVIVHGGHQEVTNMSIAFSCGEPPLFRSDHATVAVVDASFFDAAVLWP